MTTAGAPAVALVMMLAIAAGCGPRSLDVGYRIGSKPEDGQPILTSRPVADVVRDALLAELGRGGHGAVAGPGDVIAAADV